MSSLEDLLPHRRNDGTDWRVISDRDDWGKDKRDSFRHLVDVLEEAALADIAHFRVDTTVNSSAVPTDMYIFDTKRTTEQLRYLFYTMEWEKEALQWLICSAFEILPKRFLVILVRCLKYLHFKLPHVVDDSGLLDCCPSLRHGMTTKLKEWIVTHASQESEAPSSHIIRQQDADISKDVLVVLAPCEYSWDSPHLKRWKELFQHSWLVEAVNVTMSSTDDSALKKAFLEKLTALQKEHPSRKLVLVGFGVGVKVIVTAAQHKRVGGLICMAMILQSKSLAMESSIVQKDLQQLESPVAFVVGTEATKSSVKALEEARPQMKCAREIISVPGGDDSLRVNLNKKRELRMTQDIIDRRYVLRVPAVVTTHTAQMIQTAKRHPVLEEDPAKTPKVGNMNYDNELM
eukprot:gene10398-2529_t